MTLHHGSRKYVSPMAAVRRTPLDADSFERAFEIVGAIYFIRDAATDCVKIGHSTRPWDRLTALQVGNPSRLTMIGMVAAEFDVEAMVHGLCNEGHARGEWFYDREIFSPWLMEMTHGRPLYRWLWSWCVADFLGQNDESTLVRRVCSS